MTAPEALPDASYSVIVVGTGFASSFFLREYLAHAGRGDRVLVLERGHRDGHAWQISRRRNSRIDHHRTFLRAGRPEKDWNFTVAFGGGSNCWWACTPRFLPNDFRLRSRYGVGRDWPLAYDDLEEHYQSAEEVMQISGPEGGPFPRTRPYPQPPHRLSDPDRLLQQAFPDLYFAQPTARARVATGRRGVCCANGVCELCPVDAKFTIENGLAEVYDDARVTLLIETPALAVETRGGTAAGVRFRHRGEERRAAADLVALGANALFNPAILERSGLSHPLLGRRLHEQISANVYVDLDGVDNFQGSTVITGHGYMFYDGDHRRDHAACLVEGWNLPDQLRWEPGRTRQLLRLKLIVEDLPQERNRVALSPREPELPVAVFEGPSDYARRGIEAARAVLPRLLAALPVETVSFERVTGGTEAHILGTTVMGDDPETSVVDRHLVHHQVRNLLVLGGGAFPTSSPANPTLTICALSTWSARHLFEDRA
jgi:choline dehydrogenase-like flavoprotein